MRQLWEEGALSTAASDSRQPGAASISDLETRKARFSKSHSNVVHNGQIH